MFDHNSFDTEAFSSDSWLFDIVAAVRRVAKNIGYVLSKVEQLFVRTEASDLVVVKKRG